MNAPRTLLLAAALVAASPALAQSDRSYGWIIERPIAAREINRPMPGPPLTPAKILAAAQVASQLPRSQPPEPATTAFSSTSITYGSGYGGYGGGGYGIGDTQSPRNWWKTDIGRGNPPMGYSGHGPFPGVYGYGGGGFRGRRW